MLIRPVSDLHIDVSMYELPKVDTDKESVLTVAGDLCEMGFGTFPWEGWFYKHCPRFKAVIFVPGNHESYGGIWGKALEHLRDLAKKIPNLHVLEKDFVAIDDVIFVGTTFWTDCDNGNHLTYMRLKMAMADFHEIREFNPQMSHEENKKSVAFLKKFSEEFDQLSKPGDRLVVITHHPPTRQAEDPKYSASPIAGGFTSFLDEVVYEVEADLWLYGHVHYAYDFKLFGTRMLCNPRGYHSPRTGMSEGTGFNPKLVIEV